MFDPAIILCALICGLLMRSLGQPALLGYLAAGFILHELGLAGGQTLAVVSEIGITLLLFSIGLKLRPKDLLAPSIWGTTLIHMALFQVLFTILLVCLSYLLPGLGLNLTTSLIVAFALTFSSTVFVIQVMQERGEMASRHANLAIGVLIIQDIAAVVFLGFSAGKTPEWSALGLLMIFPLRGVFLRLLSLCGHGELFTLFGLALAILGAELFDFVGIKGDLGALILGAVLAGDQKAKELAQNLLYFKDLLLVGFFLSIGLSGWPEPSILIASLGLGVLALLKSPLYFLLMTRFHARPRTALLGSLALSNHSEFGLIVVAVAASVGWVDHQWSAGLSLAIAASFILSAPLNQRAHELYRRWHEGINSYQTEQLRQARPNIRNARFFVLGMGNIGTGAYNTMAEYYGHCVVGVDDNDRTLASHSESGRRVVAGDASDPDFWACVDLDKLELVMLALTNFEENKLVGKLLRELGYEGPITAVARYAEEAQELEKRGISVFNLYKEAGTGFAEHATGQLPKP
jgi:predicted Kef-type K+ transport protein